MLFVNFTTHLSSTSAISASVAAANLFDKGSTFDISKTQLKSQNMTKITSPSKHIAHVTLTSNYNVQSFPLCTTSQSPGASYGITITCIRHVTRFNCTGFRLGLLSLNQALGGNDRDWPPPRKRYSSYQNFTLRSLCIFSTSVYRCNSKSRCVVFGFSLHLTCRKFWMWHEICLRH